MGLGVVMSGPRRSRVRRSDDRFFIGLQPGGSGDPPNVLILSNAGIHFRSLADRLDHGDHHPAAALAFCLPAKGVDKAVLLSVRSSYAVERPGSYCGIVLPGAA